MSGHHFLIQSSLVFFWPNNIHLRMNGQKEKRRSMDQEIERENLNKEIKL